MPLLETKGAASAQGFGLTLQQAAPVYIEDVFQTWLYTGNGSTQTITNGIDLSTKGGLVWVKSRSNATRHELVDTNRGTNSGLYTNNTDAAGTNPSVFNFLSTGFQVGVGIGNGNENAYTYASWTFRKQPKFFDVVTYTGNGTNNRQISHSLGSTPGCIIIKNASVATNWAVWHRSVNTSRGVLNLTDAFTTTNAALYFGNGTSVVQPTSTNFTIGEDGDVNNSGNTFVAYLFAHDAGGFGLTGTDNVITCGSFTTDGSGNATVTLGYEPQWTLIKRSDSSTGGNWRINDNMRNMVAAPNLGDQLFPNLSSAESIGNGVAQPTATGFTTNNGALNASATYIYIAIRRGPMKTPTTGTSVFAPVALSSPGSVPNTLLRTTNFPVDLYLAAVRDQTFTKFAVGSRLQGTDAYLATSAVDQETFAGDLINNNWDNNTGLSIYDTNGSWNGNNSSQTTILETFRRAPGFFDVVCYSGSSSNTTQTHNLGVVPEMIIVKSRTSSRGWPVYTSPTGAGNFLFLNSTDESAGASTYWNNTTPTASVFSLGTAANTNNSGENYVAYLFATTAGVSKVGSYTGTGNTLQINCGFTGGARFVLIKRTDVAGAWYVWDSARGIVSGNDPYLVLNSNAAEVTTTDWVDTHSPGFELSNAAGNNVNINGGTFVFLAIA
jgi:hypothetical protein